MSGGDKLAPIRRWFTSRSWEPFAFQERVWAAHAKGHSGLLHASTGTGKTLAAFGGPLAELCGSASPPPGLCCLWLTPMRALAGDTRKSLIDAAIGSGALQDESDTRIRIELRTGDTTSTMKAKQRAALPHVLITTPESLSVLLSYPGSAEQFANLSTIIVDEWHELLAGKRGVQTELCLASLRRLTSGHDSGRDAVRAPLRIWGLSATIGNTQQALDTLVGTGPHARTPLLIEGELPKRYEFTTLIPPSLERFPWAGHLGLRMLPQVVRQLEAATSTLLFTNTRSQTEIWFQALTKAKPEWLGKVALHHGSLDRALRTRVEDMAKSGALKCVVCTSSLDLGVDFPPVDQVIQIGSPKGVARLMQRAGRAGHQPGSVSRIVCVPTSGLELVEFAAARAAVADGRLEPREPVRLALDVLCQHVMTMVCGAGPDGIDPALLAQDARATRAFADLTDQQWHWVLAFASRGGQALQNYERFARLLEQTNLATGQLRLVAANQPIVKLHRLGIGTITSDASMQVRLATGKVLGTIEEGFISRLSPGNTFVFSGRRLRLLRVREMSAIVQLAEGRSGVVPAWSGSRMPLSSRLAEAVMDELARASTGEFSGPEMQCARPLLELQARWSALPVPGTILIEQCQTREGHHLFIYPLAGRLVHEGLSALCAHRIASAQPATFSLSCSDYGFELLSPARIAPTQERWRAIFSPENLAADLVACVNSTELAKRQFRDIARVAGLMTPTFPSRASGGKGSTRGSSARQLQASSELLFDVLRDYDPENLLLDQARREVLERQLEFTRLLATLQRIQQCELRIIRTDRLTPFAFPLWVDRLREQLSSEQAEDRVQRMLAQLEDFASHPGSRAAADNAAADLPELTFVPDSEPLPTPLPSPLLSRTRRGAYRRPRL